MLAFIKRRLATFIRQEMQETRLTTSAIFGDPSRVIIAESAVVNNALFNVQSGTITIGDFAFFGHNVCVLTGTHDIQRRGKDRLEYFPTSGRDIVIGSGAWVCSNATIIGPCTIGRDAVIAAGAVVISDVPADAVFAGVPARQVSTIDSRIEQNN